MDWFAIEKIIEGIVTAFGPVGVYIARFMRVTAEHLYKRHAIDIEEAASLEHIGEWLLSAAMCGIRRVLEGAAGQHCPDSHPVSEGHGKPAPG